MKIFVESRGRSPDFEYCWQPEVPPRLSGIYSLIQSESPSVVLARFQKRLMLLATGLNSLEKKDFRDRPIRHSIMWLFDENYDSEVQIRAIAVQALQGLLANQADKHIQFGGESGFETSISGIEAMSRSFLTQESVGTSPLPSLELPPKIGKNSQALRDDLAYKLQQYSLPKNYEFIVVATGVKSEESLEKAGAWRSLSNLVKSENWRNLPKSEAQQPKKVGAAIAIVAAIVVVALILLVVLLHPFSPKPEMTPSPSPGMTRSKPEVEVNPEQVDQNSSIRDLTSLEKDLTPSMK
ncbi:MAG: hypothetical protein HC799_18025 [Limnothrix sp. RL_2_0]|nr:hypothetical protein [Limnothrix sp. RL_2_0]